MNIYLCKLLEEDILANIISVKKYLAKHLSIAILKSPSIRNTAVCAKATTVNNVMSTIFLFFTTQNALGHPGKLWNTLEFICWSFSGPSVRKPKVVYLNTVALFCVFYHFWKLLENLESGYQQNLCHQWGLSSWFAGGHLLITTLGSGCWGGREWEQALHLFSRTLIWPWGSTLIT